MAPDIICPAENHLNPPATWEGSLREERRKKTYKAHRDAQRCTEEPNDFSL
jgi:hypothetical protein